ncbi:YtxH domain-containing protein [Candidatus Gracilibacteria bacterium]|nr:YtxH domain-containing protein [Candidatus Gracilibacteria bacterium]
MLFKPKKNDNDKKSKDSKSLITGIVVGGAVGSVLSLLFAPDKGKNTRKIVGKKGKELYEKGKTKAEEFLDKYNKEIKEKIEEEEIKKKEEER